MKKVLSILLVVVLMASCQGRKETKSDIWLFHLGETKSEVIESLERKHIPYEEMTDIKELKGFDALVGKGFVIDYSDMDWNMFSAYFKSDKLVAIQLLHESLMTKAERAQPYEVKHVVRSLDQVYGEHLTFLPSNTDEAETVKYVWETDEIYGELMNMFNGEYVSLAICDVQYKDLAKGRE